MTQYQQVLATLKNLGGEASFDDICKNINFSAWGTKTPKNSVGRYWTCSPTWLVVAQVLQNA
ncbi:MAG: hypothetical protein LBC53_06125 [Spirochaetaceae bacterium]|jgi:hypothetical protein|nr:hypothetical protein [Spirochaetaceae bacterium]